MSMETMYICQKESVQFREETKKSLRKPPVALWTLRLEKRWENKLFP